jgi:EmrB/QacA subfamily drug resistance transporter
MKPEKSNLRWWILATVMMGTFLGRLDQTIVNLALPKIINDFGITISAAGWIATAYILANAVFVPIWGKLGDTKGRKKVYILGFSIFIVGSVLAGLSWNLSSMIIFRIIQAIASSADYPTAMAILVVTFTGKERAQALGIWSASFAVASVFGPLIGGPLIDLFGWRSVFLVNLPVGLVGLGMALHFVKESVVERVSHAFDWWGAIVLGGSLSSMVLVLDQGLSWGWLSMNSLLCYAAVIGFGVLFVYIEKHHPEPIVDLKFFKNSLFVNTVLNNFIIFMGMMGSIFLIPIFAQTFMGLTATQSGYLFIPLAFAFMLASPIGGRLIGKVKPSYVIAASTFVAGIGLFLFIGLDPRSGPLAIIVPLFIMAFGMGFGMAQRTNLVAIAVPASEIGVASSVLALARNIAGAFGIAIFGTVLNNSTNSHLLNIAKNSFSSSLSSGLVNAHEYATAIGLMELKAQVDAYSTVFILGGAIILVAAFLAFFIKVDKSKLTHEHEVVVE